MGQSERGSTGSDLENFQSDGGNTDPAQGKSPVWGLGRHPLLERIPAHWEGSSTDPDGYPGLGSLVGEGLGVSLGSPCRRKGFGKAVRRERDTHLGPQKKERHRRYQRPYTLNPFTTG